MVADTVAWQRTPWHSWRMPCPARAVLFHLLRLPTLEFSFAPVIKTNGINPAAGTRLQGGRGHGWQRGRGANRDPPNSLGCGTAALQEILGNSHSCSAQPSQTHDLHILTVPWPVLGSTTSPVPALEHPRMLRVPSVSPVIRAWAGSQSLADGNDGRGGAETAAPCSDGASRAGRGINAPRRFLFLPVDPLSQHKQLLSGPACHPPALLDPAGSLWLSPPQEKIPTEGVRGLLLGQESVWSQARPWRGSSA